MAFPEDMLQGHSVNHFFDLTSNTTPWHQSNLAMNPKVDNTKISQMNIWGNVGGGSFVLIAYPCQCRILVIVCLALIHSN